MSTVEAANTALNAVLDLHVCEARPLLRPNGEVYGSQPVCAHCTRLASWPIGYPCPTIAALAEVADTVKAES